MNRAVLEAHLCRCTLLGRLELPFPHFQQRLEEVDCSVWHPVWFQVPALLRPLSVPLSVSECVLQPFRGLMKVTAESGIQSGFKYLHSCGRVTTLQNNYER